MESIPESFGKMVVRVLKEAGQNTVSLSKAVHLRLRAEADRQFARFDALVK